MTYNKAIFIILTFTHLFTTAADGCGWFMKGFYDNDSNVHIESPTDTLNEKEKEMQKLLKANQPKHAALSNMQIEEVPEEVFELTSLKSLSLSDNFLQYIPDQLTNLISLEYLDLDHNQIKTIPKFGNIPLSTLCIADNELKEVSAELFANLKSLRLLSLTNNQIPLEQINKLKKELPNVRIVF